MFKITFNKPAFKMFFAGEDAKGIEIKVEDRTVMFKPVIKLDDRLGVSTITERPRGGAETFIEGSQEARLFSLLMNPLGNPYFLLRRAAGGWMEAIPHTGPKHAPERWEPHIRIWPLEATNPQTVETPARLRPELPASEEARETLCQLEATLSGVTKAPFGTAFAAVHSAQALINRFLAFCHDHPLPNQKQRKTRHGRNRVSVGMATTSRRQRDRVFPVSA